MSPVKTAFTVTLLYTLFGPAVGCVIATLGLAINVGRAGGVEGFLFILISSIFLFPVVIGIAYAMGALPSALCGLYVGIMAAKKKAINQIQYFIIAGVGGLLSLPSLELLINPERWLKRQPKFLSCHEWQWGGQHTHTERCVEEIKFLLFIPVVAIVTAYIVYPILGKRFFTPELPLSTEGM